jgi:hypothetical protein
VYAVRWENASTSRSGWSLATRGGWSRSGRLRPEEYLALTDDVLASHLRGELTVGIYPLQRAETCALVACDFDEGTWVPMRSPIWTRATPAPSLRCRSVPRSGNGGHL